jgi:OPT family oligopeptide transporter
MTTTPASPPEHLPVGEHAEGFTEIPPPPLPDDATPEQKEEHWFRHVYQGDRMKQLTLRAVLMGGGIGMMMSIAGLYTTLKIGWSFGVAITSCVISYVIWNGLRAISGNTLTPMTILENNCMQSTASAAGYSTGATIATAFGALLLLVPSGGDVTPESIETWGVQPVWIVACFTLTTAAMGVFLAIPMKRQMINIEKLPFPSGIAAATTLRSLYSRGAEAVQKAYSLVIALVCGALVGFLNTGEGGLQWVDKFFEWMKKNVFNIRLPEELPFGAEWLGVPAGKRMMGFLFEPSVLLVAAGMIVGMRVSLSMLASSALLYFFVAPRLIQVDVTHLGQAAEYIVNIPLNGAGTQFRINQWSLWGGTSVMVVSSLMAIVLQWKTILRAFTLRRGADAPDSPIRAKMAAIEVPKTWLIAGMIPITIGLLAVQYYAFEIELWKGLIAVAMAFVLSMVACRATGETDTTPVGAMGKVMQLLFALISKKNIQHNLMSASVAANSASSSADLLTDLKSGYLLGANPRKQFLAQFIGLFFGTLSIVPAWYLLVPNKAALEKFNPPATNMWKAVAEALTKGLHTIPDSAITAIEIGAFIGIVLPILEKAFPKARGYLPSAMGIGLAWVVSFSNSMAFAIGAIIAWGWMRAEKKSGEKFIIPIASGLVAGESLMKAILAMWATAAGLLSKP